jgi:hypothetical protein
LPYAPAPGISDEVKHITLNAGPGTHWRRSNRDSVFPPDQIAANSSTGETLVLSEVEGIWCSPAPHDENRQLFQKPKMLFAEK